jgi:hypothetical protein
MNNLGNINKTDKFRILLTEVLPYETPLWFTNEFFYDVCINSGLDNIPSSVRNYFTVEGKKQTHHQSRIPLNYRIKKDTVGERELSVMHPNSQLEFVEFYNKYKDLLIYYCNKEEVSLRKPVKIANRFIKEKSLDSIRVSGVEEDNAEREYCSSYFVYDRMGFIYKFYESYEFHRLEKKYPFLIKLDVARCFNHIYTHAIEWAAKSKAFVKNNLKPFHSSFASEFDSLMRTANYDETNGILIGPEISRIFAEIILQRIDQDTIRILGKNGIHFKKDYEFRRYVDDYFFFYNDLSLKSKITEAIEKSLEFYRLYINDQKREFLSRPFISNLTMCKKELLTLINRKYGEDRYKKIISIGKKEGADSFLFKDFLKDIPLYRSSNTANNFIVDIKMIVKKYNVESMPFP